MSGITEMTFREFKAAVASRTISVTEAVKSSIARIRETAGLNNYITLCEDDALAAAVRIDEKLRRGEKAGELCGLPIAVKDNICVAGLPVTCGSKLYINNIAEHTADSVMRLQNAGAIVIGKTNMDEFAMGSTNESSAFGAVKNALDNTRVPGGSSGGSANAVSAGQVFCALGTDTGGSIRQPAAYCGVVGFKPTFGAISNRGLVSFVPSLDTIGITSADCEGASVMFGVLSGRPTEIPRGEINGVTIGIADEFLSGGIASDEVANEFACAVEKLERVGAKIVRVSIPSFCAGLSAYHVLSSAEAAYNITRAFDGEALREAGGEVKRRITAGTLAVSGKMYDELYMRAAKVRAVIKREYIDALSHCDALVCPTSPTTATKLGHSSDPNKAHYGDYFLAPASLAGLPAVSVPVRRGNGLPVGIQLIGKYNSEYKLLEIGRALEL